MNSIVSLISLILYSIVIEAASASITAQDYVEAASSSDNELVHVLIYETEKVEENLPVYRLIDQINNKLHGMKATAFGQGRKFDGFGSKFTAVLPVLREMSNPETLVVVSDGRDVLINNPYNDDMYIQIIADEFKMAYDELTFNYNGAIVISAEAQCCVSALTHAIPGSYFNIDGSRNERACPSGEAGCLWAGDDMALPWEDFMTDLMLQRTKDSPQGIYDDMFLNAGLMAGKVKDLIRVFDKLQISTNEDDQAVLTDYMFRYPNDIVLDYQQKMFGNNRWGDKLTGCIFEKQNEKDDASRLVHKKTNTSPLFVHSPGGFLECHDALADVLGVPAVSQIVRRRLKQTTDDRRLNYGLAGFLSRMINPDTEINVGGSNSTGASTGGNGSAGSDGSTGSDAFALLADLPDSNSTVPDPVSQPSPTPENPPTGGFGFLANLVNQNRTGTNGKFGSLLSKVAKGAKNRTSVRGGLLQGTITRAPPAN